MDVRATSNGWTTHSGDTSGQVWLVMGPRMDVAVLAAGEAVGEGLRRTRQRKPNSNSFPGSSVTTRAQQGKWERQTGTRKESGPSAEGIPASASLIVGRRFVSPLLLRAYFSAIFRWCQWCWFNRFGLRHPWVICRPGKRLQQSSAPAVWASRQQLGKRKVDGTAARLGGKTGQLSRQTGTARGLDGTAARRHARVVEAALDRTEIIGLNVIFGRAAALHWKDDCAWHALRARGFWANKRHEACSSSSGASRGRFESIVSSVGRIDFPGNEQGECLEKGKLEVRVSDSEGVQAERRGFEGSRGGGVESEKKRTTRGEVRRGDRDGRIGGQGKLKLL
ncbi:hypothetical protein CSOJ01_02860 [Colletotrichum sojae]|uniref:Uncharacterized protein n=1 Tax=Colletotrichum sojae TaxID=2175907 RepID=A0A8H6JPB4_9PEZI|nr:hypothetical protein CSOJ01_02860 [Colletotrichum sojae]